MERSARRTVLSQEERRKEQECYCLWQRIELFLILEMVTSLMLVSSFSSPFKAALRNLPYFLPEITNLINRTYQGGH